MTSAVTRRSRSVTMGAGVLGEGPHELQASGLGRNAGADQRRASLFFNCRRDVLDGTHVEPARGGILALGQADCLARDDCAPFEGFTLPEKLLPGDGLSGRDARSSADRPAAQISPSPVLWHPCAPAAFAGTRTRIKMIGRPSGGSTELDGPAQRKGRGGCFVLPRPA